MSIWGSVDFSQLQKLGIKIEHLRKVDAQKFYTSVAKELAARLLEKTMERTPKGDYPASSGKVGGTLKRGWTANTHEEAAAGAGDGKNPRAYAYSLPVERQGDTFTITVSNPVRYAPYVEYGHRLRNGGFHPPVFMLQKSEIELASDLEKIIYEKLKKLLGDILE